MKDKASIKKLKKHKILKDLDDKQLLFIVELCRFYTTNGFNRTICDVYQFIKDKNMTKEVMLKTFKKVGNVSYTDCENMEAELEKMSKSYTKGESKSGRQRKI